MPVRVADTSLLIAYSGIDRLDVLRGIFPLITITPAVLAELENGDWKEARAILREIRSGTWIKIVQAPNLEFPIAPPAHLGAGELETLRLASHTHAVALVDDGGACRFARQIQVPVVRSLAILALAKQRGLIETTRPLVTAMADCGIRLAPDLISRFLEKMGES